MCYTVHRPRIHFNFHIFIFSASGAIKEYSTGYGSMECGVPEFSSYLIYRILKSYDLKEKDVQVNISIITVTVSKIDGKLRVQQLCRGCVCREFSSYRILKSYDLNGSKS